MEYTTDIEIETAPGVYEEIEIVVSYDWQPFEQMTRDYPGCEESVDIYKVTADGAEIAIPDEDLRRIEEQIVEDRHEEAEGRLADAADYYYEQERDRRMMEVE